MVELELLEFIVYLNPDTKEIRKVTVYCDRECECSCCPYKDICDEIYNAILNIKYAKKLRKEA